MGKVFSNYNLIRKQYSEYVGNPYDSTAKDNLIKSGLRNWAW
jgi:hypothetical protein